MLKTGRAMLHSLNDEIVYFVWSTGTANYERMDIIWDLNKYSVLDTSNCLAAYYKKQKERILGDEKIIREIYKIEREASLLAVPEDKKMEMKDGKFTMEIKKENPGIGVYYNATMVNGRFTYQEFQTSLGLVSIDSFSVDGDSDITPLNIDDYTVLEPIGGEGKTVKTVKSEYYSYEEILRKYPQVMHVLDPSNDYGVVSSYEEGVARLKEWKESKEQLKSYDIESYGLDWGIWSDNRITGVILGLGTNWAWFFPFRQEAFKYNLPLEFLREIFDAINNQPAYPEVIILGHNLKFEVQGFYQEYEDFVRCDVDTLLLAILIDPVVKKGSHSLKAVTGRIDSRFYLSLEMIFIGPVQFNVLPEEIVKLYACPDATSPAKIYQALFPKLPDDELFVFDLERQLPSIKAMNEFYGLRLDMERVTTLRQDAEYNLEVLGNTFKAIHHTSRNINSNDVLKEIMYDKLRCPVEVYTNKGQPSTGKVARKRIVDTGHIQIDENTPIPAPILGRHGEVLVDGKDLASNKYPSMVIYQRYKLCEKEVGAFRRLEKKSDHGYFKFYINQSGAGSNRQTSDAHQFSSAMKDCALSDSPYHGLCSCDWKQIELRVLAAEAKQMDLLEMEKNPEIDIHRAVFNIISKKPMWMISEEDRKDIKPVNFGVVYMMTEYGLAVREFGPSYTRAQLMQEKKKITDFFNGLPNVKAYLDKNEQFLKDNGYIKTAFNYYRFFPELLDPTIDPKRAQRLVRSGNNTPVQGTAAQLLKIVEVKIWRYMRDHGWLKCKDYNGVRLPIARMILPIHDEILFSYDKELISKEEVCLMFKVCMELEIEGYPPLFAAPAFIDNWGQGKDPAYEVDILFRDKVVEEYKKGNMLLAGKDYLKVLGNYRDSVLSEYMSGLIAKYVKLDDVAEHVRDDNLTHVLIETMLPSKERKKLTHMERIYEATKRYMEQLEESGELNRVVATITPIDDDNRQEFMETDTWLDTYAHIDANGDLIEEIDEFGEEEEEEFATFDEMAEEERYVTESPFIYMMSEVLIDISSLDIKGNGEIFHRGVAALSDPNAYYQVIYVQGSRMVRTNMKIGYYPEELDALYKQVTSTEVLKYGT